jgi:hypothetical protein
MSNHFENFYTDLELCENEINKFDSFFAIEEKTDNDFLSYSQNEISTNTNEANLNGEVNRNEQNQINNNNFCEKNIPCVYNNSGNKSEDNKNNEMRNDSYFRSIINMGFKIFFSKLEKL